MASDQLPLGLERTHTHLRLSGALPPRQRVKRPGGGRGTPRYPDAAGHARDIQEQVEWIRDRHIHRASVLGINPEQVVVIEFNSNIDLDELHRAELQLLGYLPRRAMVAFADDPDLRKFVARCQSYKRPVPPGKKSHTHEALFDAIDNIRPLDPDDVIDPHARERLASCPPETLLRLDVECWCPESESETRRRFDETKTAMLQAGCQVLSDSCRYIIGFSRIRALIPASVVKKLADTTRVRMISLLARPQLTVPELVQCRVEDLPEVLEPARHAATVAVIDSGIRAGHPLLAPAVTASLALDHRFSDGEDANGHGTLVTSLVLFGTLEHRLRAKTPIRPAGRVVSIRVLDETCGFPDDRMWEEDLEQAIELAVRHGARIVNLSIGDAEHPYRPPGPTPIAAMLDRLIRAHDLVVVVAAGNFLPMYYPNDRQITTSYPTWLREYEDAGILPPAMTALGLTVGALVAESWQGVLPHRESVDHLIMGQPLAPSPVTTIGPGIQQMVKPELSAPGGSYVYDNGLGQVLSNSPGGGVVGAGAEQPDRLLACAAGTSMAAPIAGHAAARVLGRYPTLTANTVRALLLASAVPVQPVFDGGTPAELAREERRLSGYGRVTPERAETSSDHRSVLLAEERLLPDQVHFYAVPVPRAFFVGGRRQRTIGIACSFDPEVRATRMDYLASRMSVFAYRGLAIDEVMAKHAQATAADEPPPIPPRNQIELQPSDQIRLLGANQVASAAYKQRWPDHDDQDMVVVVRNTNKWAPESEPQRYSLVVVFEVDEDLPEIYAELAARLEAVIEIEPEIELDSTDR